MALTPSVPALAQETQGPAPESGLLEAGGDATGPAAAKTLDNVVVTAERSVADDLQTSRGSVLFGDVDLREIPFSVNVVGEDTMRRRRAVGLSDILVTDPAYTPGYGAHGGGVSEGTGALRGFSTSQVILDGIQLSDINIPETELLERVEVLRGPAAFRYGFLAPGGAINQVSKKPTSYDQIILSTTVDSWGMYSGHADISTRLGPDDRFGVRLNLVGSKGDVFIDDVEQERRLFGLTTEYRIGDDSLLTLNYSNTAARSDKGDFGVGNVIVDVNYEFLPGLGPEFNYTQDFVFNDDEKSRYGVTFESALSDSVDFYTNLQYVTLDELFATFYFYDVQPSGDAIGEDGYGAYDWDDLSNTSYLTWEFTTGPVRHRLTGGYAVHLSNFKNNFLAGDLVAINVYDLQPITPTAPRDTTPTYNSETDRIGVFVSDQFDIGERWHGVLGLRWSQIDIQGFDYNTGVRDFTVKNEAVTPMAGVLYDLTDHVGIYVSGGTGLEPGGRAPLDASNPNEQMPALESTMFEAGLKSELVDGALTLDVAAFAIERTAEYYLGPGTRYDQYGKARHIGAEVLLNGRIGNALQLSGGVQYLDTEQLDTGDSTTEGRPAPFVPPLQATLEAIYNFQSLPGWSLMTRAVAQDRMELSNQDTDFESPGYVRFDAGLRYEREFENVSLAAQLTVENAGDIVYYPGQLQYGPPRTVFAGLDLRW